MYFDNHNVQGMWRGAGKLCGEEATKFSAIMRGILVPLPQHRHLRLSEPVCHTDQLKSVYYKIAKLINHRFAFCVLPLQSAYIRNLDCGAPTWSASVVLSKRDQNVI